MRVRLPAPVVRPEGPRAGVQDVGWAAPWPNLEKVSFPVPSLASVQGPRTREHCVGKTPAASPTFPCALAKDRDALELPGSRMEERGDTGPSPQPVFPRKGGVTSPRGGGAHEDPHAGPSRNPCAFVQREGSLTLGGAAIPFDLGRP